MEKQKVIGLQEELEILSHAVKRNHPVLLVGETGLGKTYAVRHLARKKDKLVKRVPLNGEVGINELLGKWLVRDGSTYWQDGVLVECMKNGNWILLDEINAALPEVLFCLNSIMDDSKSIVLAEKNNEQIETHSDFRIFATMNPTAEYTGTKELNKALLSRFVAVIWMKNYEATLEKKIVIYHSDVDEYSARIMVDIANAIRKLKQEKKIFYTCSLRDIISWALLFRESDSLNLEQTFRYSILNKADEDEREVIFTVAKKTPEVKLDWNWTQSDMEPKLTKGLKEAIAKLEERRERLNQIIGEMEGKLKKLSKEINK